MLLLRDCTSPSSRPLLLDRSLISIAASVSFIPSILFSIWIPHTPPLCLCELQGAPAAPHDLHRSNPMRLVPAAGTAILSQSRQTRHTPGPIRNRSTCLPAAGRTALSPLISACC
jgi:hypothetical protein